LNVAYGNIKDMELKWSGYTSTIEFNNDARPNYFSAPQNYFDRKTSSIWRAKQFHWHTKSEHTIEGSQYDLEIHVVHFTGDAVYQTAENNGGYAGAVLGFLFDVNNNNGDVKFRETYVDPLFDSMELDKTGSYKPAEVKIGDFMNAVRNWNRWNYVGSLTTPPCSESINFNIITTVFPIRDTDLAKFKKI